MQHTAEHGSAHRDARNSALTHAQVAMALRLGSMRATEGEADAKPAAETAVGTPTACARRVASCVTLAMIAAGALAVARAQDGVSLEKQQESRASGSSAERSGGLIPRAPDGCTTGAGAQDHEPTQEQTTMFSKLAPMTAASAVGLVASIAGAQVPAVQWRVADGGNGHWYGDDNRPGFATFADRQAAYLAMGAHLATVSSAAEHAFIISVAFPSGEILPSDTWPALGGHKPSNSTDWAWVTGEPFEYSPFSPDPPQFQQEQYLMMWGQGVTPLLWWTGNGNSTLQRSIIEWSADCNADGIVDYGQCINGTLPDYDGNNIPDCCERNEACVVGNYPVQWREADGGNAHWYAQSSFGGMHSWQEAHDAARSRGAYLATIVSSGEQLFIESVSRTGTCESWGGMIWLGARQPPALRPNEGWQWITNEPWDFTNWSPGEPNDYDGWPEDRLCMYASTGKWNDGTDQTSVPLSCNFAAMYEWSADCNSDGIVDYGQILTGQLADTNANGIPDICEQPTCADADLFANGVINGADLGILLSEWGPANPNTVSDINRDGQVDGLDLGTLLGFWGPCTP